MEPAERWVVPLADGVATCLRCWAARVRGWRRQSSSEADHLVPRVEGRRMTGQVQVQVVDS